MSSRVAWSMATVRLCLKVLGMVLRTCGPSWKAEAGRSQHGETWSRKKHHMQRRNGSESETGQCWTREGLWETERAWVTTLGEHKVRQEETNPCLHLTAIPLIPLAMTYF